MSYRKLKEKSYLKSSTWKKLTFSTEIDINGVKLEMEDDVSVEYEVLQCNIDVLVNIPANCCRCESVFVNELKLKKHAVQKHRPKNFTPSSQDSLQCSVCYIKFLNEDNIKEHIAGKHNIRPLHKCDFCGCCFYSLNGLAKHKRIFHTNELYKCCGCNFSSKERNMLLMHDSYHKKNDMLR